MGAKNKHLLKVSKQHKYCWKHPSDKLHGADTQKKPASAKYINRCNFVSTTLRIPCIATSRLAEEFCNTIRQTSRSRRHESNCNLNLKLSQDNNQLYTQIYFSVQYIIRRSITSFSPAYAQIQLEENKKTRHGQRMRNHLPCCNVNMTPS